MTTVQGERAGLEPGNRKRRSASGPRKTTVIDERVDFNEAAVNDQRAVTDKATDGNERAVQNKTTVRSTASREPIRQPFMTSASYCDEAADCGKRVGVSDASEGTSAPTKEKQPIVVSASSGISAPLKRKTTEVHRACRNHGGNR